MESERDFEDFIYSEVEKIKIDKWVEGEKTHKDPGIEYEMYWVHCNAKNYRESWFKSKCRTCVFCRVCGYNALSACDKYEEN